MTYKIGIVSIWPLTGRSFGGTEKFAGDLGMAISGLGHEVEFISPSSSRKYRNLRHICLSAGQGNEFSEYSIKRILESGGVTSFCDQMAASLCGIALRQKYDCLIINSPLLALANQVSFGQVVVLHDNPHELINYFGDKATKEIVHRLRLLPYSAVLVAPSKYYASMFGHMLRRPVVDIPHALLCPVSAVAPAHHRDELRILTNSRLEWRQKGQDMAIKAISKLKFPVCLTLTGDDPIYRQSKKYLYDLADKLGVRSRVKVVFAKKMSAVFRDNDLILLPSRFESFGYSAQEAIASGMKVILSDIPTFCELSIGAKNIALFKKDSVASLVRTLSSSNMIPAVKPSTSWFKRYSQQTWVRRYLKTIGNAKQRLQ